MCFCGFLSSKHNNFQLFLLTKYSSASQISSQCCSEKSGFQHTASDSWCVTGHCNSCMKVWLRNMHISIKMLFATTIFTYFATLFHKKKDVLFYRVSVTASPPLTPYLKFQCRNGFLKHCALLIQGNSELQLNKFH